MDAIRIEGLVKRYGRFFSRRKVVAVDHLDLQVEEKQIFGFLGPNGAGKTTTIKALLGLVIPDRGHAFIFGAPSSDREIKRRVGFLPDSPSFYNHLSGREFVAFCGKLLRVPRAERYRRVDELLEKMGLTEAAHGLIEGYSRGMLQRLGIAQAIINNPDLIILDEPVSGLDPHGRRQVKQVLVDLHAEGKTIFFSSHILTDVEEMCHQVAILNHGQLLVKGPLEEILRPTGFAVSVSGLSTAAIEQAESLSSQIRKEGARWCLNVDDISDRGKLLAFITEHGGVVEESMTRRESLEQSFLRRIEEDDARRTMEEAAP